MKIAIVGSMVFAPEMLKISQDLKTDGHSVKLPPFTLEYAQKFENGQERSNQASIIKRRHDAIRKYFEIIKDCDAILVANYDRHNVKNYIGGNSFLEIGFAYILHKRIFLFNPIPQMIYTDEIDAINPIILNGDLTKIKF